MTQRENYLRAIKFANPDYIPMLFVINDSCYENYKQEELFALVESHKFLFPDFKRPKEKYIPKYMKVAQKDKPYYDSFSCFWETTMDGIVGTVTKHPLADYENLKTYVWPDPDKCNGLVDVNWNEIKKEIAMKKQNGELAIGELRHGHTFLQLCDIRGYVDLLFDMEDENENLDFIIKKIEDFNLAIIQKYIDMQVDIILIPEDLGMQEGPMISPKHFEKYILPSYRKYIKLIKSHNILVHMHSDGDIRLLVNGLISGGVDAFNCQDLVNGIAWLKDNIKGKVCLDVDIDRQVLTPFKTPKEIDEHIKNIVEELGSKAGGLMLVYGLYPGVPIENVKAVMDAMEKYAFYYQKEV